MGVNHLTVLSAEPRHSEAIYRIASDPLVRKLALNSDGFSFSSHQAWFLEKLQSQDYLIFVIQEKKEIVACVRYEKSGATIEAHLAVAPEAWGRGIATAALKLTQPEAMRRWLNVEQIAHILPAHEISKRVFTKAGYVFQEHTNFKGRSVERWCIPTSSISGEGPRLCYNHKSRQR